MIKYDNKKGISAVVATVLIILITVAAVTIIWTAVIPMIKNQASFENELVELSIDTSQGYTVWDEENKSLSIQVKRGNDNNNLSGIQFIFSREGESVTKIVYDVMDKNQAKVYSFNLSSFSGAPSMISIAPIFSNGRIGNIVSEATNIPLGEVTGVLINLDEDMSGEELEDYEYKQTGVGLGGLLNFDELPYLKEGVQVLQVSSFGRDGLNSNDGFTGKWSYLYKENEDWVIFDEYGPGAILNTWMTGEVLNNSGRILFYFDNEITPRIDMKLSDFFSSTAGAPFTAPLAGKISSTRYSFVPILFNERLKIVMTEQPYFYHFTYHKYDNSVELESYTGGEDLSQIRNMFNNKGSHPTGDEGTEISSGVAGIGVGQTVSLLNYFSGDYNYISSLKVDPSPSSDKVLDNLRLRMYWDGEAVPSVDVPLGEFFGSGIGETNIASLPIGMSTSGYYYSYFPMPFSNSAKIEIYNGGTESVNINYIIRGKQDEEMVAGKNAGYFKVEYNQEFPTQKDVDYTFLSKEGRGHYVGVIHTMRGLATFSDEVINNSRRRYLEGDERFFIDGKLSPSMHGTGSEDYYMGAYYFGGLPYDKAMFGVHNEYNNDSLGRYDYNPYRFQIYDFVPFESVVKLGMEHGGTNEGPATISLQKKNNGNYSSVAFYYLVYDVGMILTDSVDVGNSASEESHSYISPSGVRVSTSSFKYPGYDVDIPMTVSDDGKTFIDGYSEFVVNLEPDNRGVVLRRRLDYSLANQLAEVYVDGKFAGKWYTSGSHDVYNQSTNIRWLDSDLDISWNLTRGKSEVTVRIESDSWNEFYYWVYTKQNL